MLSRIYWFFFGLAVLDIARAIPQPPAEWNSPRAAPVSSQDPVDCPAWPDPDYSQLFPQKGCLRYRDVVVDGGMAEIWKEKNVLQSEGKTRLWLANIVGRTKQVLEFYGTNLKTNYKQNLKINITMVRSDKPSTLLTGSRAVTMSEERHCHVIIKVYPLKDPIWVAHYVAHELYHCVQNQEHPENRPGKFIWVVDGSANFFRYLQYPANPTDEVDKTAPQFYNPGVELYEQNYTSCLFFHFLHHSKWSLQKIDTWVSKRELSNTADAERQALVEDGEMADAFGEFAIEFHKKLIYFNAKKTFRIHADIPVPAQPRQDVSIPTEGVTVPFKFGAVTSWTFKKYSVRLQSGQTVSTTLEWTNPASPNVVVWSRVLRDGKSPSIWAKKLPKVHSGCKGVATYEFLVVPITKESTVEGQLNFKREQDESCSCKNKSAGSKPIKRTPEIAHRDLDPIIARQQRNNNGSCSASLASSSTHTMNVGEVIQSIIGGDPNQIAVSTTTGETNCVRVTSVKSDATLGPWHTQNTFTPISALLPTVANSRISESNKLAETSSTTLLTQVIEPSQIFPPTTIQEPTTATPTTASPPSTVISSIEPTTSTDVDGSEEGGEWDSTWPTPETDSSDQEPEETTSDDEDEGGSCGQCLLGTWNADKASMDEHSKNPHFQLIPSTYNKETANFTTTFKLVFSERPAGEGTDDEKLISLFLHQELVEEENIHAKIPFDPLTQPTTMRTVMTSIWDNVVSGSRKQVTAPEGDYESGSVYHPPNPTTKGDLKVAYDGEPLEPSTFKTDGQQYAPLGSGFYYNCSGDTLTYERGVELKKGANYYVFHRG